MRVVPEPGLVTAAMRVVHLPLHSSQMKDEIMLSAECLSQAQVTWKQARAYGQIWCQKSVRQGDIISMKSQTNRMAKGRPEAIGRQLNK